MRLFSVAILLASSGVCLCKIDYSEKHFKNIRQMTWGGENVYPTLSPDGKWIVYQGSGLDMYGLCCDQIYIMHSDVPGDKQTARRVSSGIGMATRPAVHKDGKHMLIASTVETRKQKKGLHGCPRRLCLTDEEKNLTHIDHTCRQGLTWDLFPEFDIYRVNKYGNAVVKLTDTDGYDAEADVSPDGTQVVFTSMRTGDPEIWISDIDGTQVRQLTKNIGYDGHPMFSNDGTKITYRSTRPKTPKEVREYRRLLSDNRVSPLAMEIFIMNKDGTDQRQVTKLGGVNYTPVFLKGDKRIIFSSNFNATGGCNDFDMYIIDIDGNNLERVTGNPGHFDAFPHFDSEFKTIVWSSDRNSTVAGEANIFIADWVDDVEESKE